MRIDALKSAWLIDLFEQDHEEFLRFADIPAERRLSNRPDLHAFLLIDQMLPGRNCDIVDGAEHDEIYLDCDVDQLAQTITEEQAIDLIRCGVRYSKQGDGLAMFA